MTSTDKLTDSNHSNCLPSSSTASPHSNQEHSQINHHDPCMVYWDHYQPLGLINQIRSVSPSTPADPLLKTNVSKRNSAVAGIPSPSKPRAANDDQRSRRTLRDSKRRKDRPVPDPNKTTTHVPPQPAHKIPLPSRQRAALDALASRISLRKKQASLTAISPIAAKPDQPRVLPLTSIKGKNPDRSNENKNTFRLPVHLLPNQNASSNLPTPKTSSVQTRTRSDSELTRVQPKPNHSSHNINPSSSSKPSNQKLVIQENQRIVQSNFSNQYQPRDESKLRHSTKPTVTASPLQEETPTTSIKPQTNAVQVKSDAIGEPWDAEEDEEFGSQLMELVDLVEKEQSSNPDLKKSNLSTQLKILPPIIQHQESLASAKIKSKPNNLTDKKEFMDSSRPMAVSSVQDKLASKKNLDQQHQQPPPKTKLGTNTGYINKQNPITSAYKNALLVTKPTISNNPIRQSTPHHNGLLLNKNKSGSVSSVVQQQQQRGDAGGKKVEINLVNNSSPSTRQVSYIKNTSPNGIQLSKIITHNNNNNNTLSNKMSYSTALIGGTKIEHNYLVDKSKNNLITRKPTIITNFTSVGKKISTGTTTTHDLNDDSLLGKSMDLELLFNGIQGEDLDWDPSQ